MKKHRNNVDEMMKNVVKLMMGNSSFREFYEDSFMNQLSKTGKYTIIKNKEWDKNEP